MADRSTIYEVAKRSGVSTATVSRVMADGKGFSAATRERVQATAAELGWVPSGPARGLASRRAGVVGLLFPDLGQSGAAEEESPLYVDQVIRGAERAATSVGDAVLIAATRGASGRQLAFSVAGKADGLVVMARSLPEDDIAAAHHTRPALSTVRQPMRELGEQSLRTLLARIAYPVAPRQSVVLPTEIVIRRSCGCRSRSAHPRQPRRT